MKIWNGDITLKMLNDLNQDTLGGFFGIQFIEIGDDYINAEMTVENKHRQPFGLLHGGASVALAETLGSVGSWCAVNRDLFMGVGMEINANHLKAVTKGIVKAHCKAIKVGGKVHVWDIRLTDETGDLCCICRFTCMVVARRS